MVRKTAVAAMLLAMAATSSCSRSHANGGRLAYAGEMNEVSVDLRVQPEETVLLGSMTVCTEGGKAEVSRVQSMDPAVNVTGYSIRPNPFAANDEMIGFARGRLEDDGLARDQSSDLDLPCGDETSFYELIIEIQAGKSDAQTPGFRVVTESGDDDALEIEYATSLCVDLSTARCREHAPDLPDGESG